MKKRIFSFLMIAMMCFGMVGCSTESKAVNAEISGSFCVMVRDVIPDYCLDDFTPQVAVVTEFQDLPFTVYLGEELVSQVEAGKAYVFTVKTKEIGQITQEQLSEYIDPVVVINEYELSIESIRPAEDGEWGLEGPELEYNILK